MAIARSIIKMAIASTNPHTPPSKTKLPRTMSSGNILAVTDVLNFLVSGIDKITLEAELTTSGWIFTPARGGSKSGAGTIWTSPNTQYSVRIMTQPDSSSYARVYNGPGGGAPAEQPLNASGKPGSRGDTHFILLP